MKEIGLTEKRYTVLLVVITISITSIVLTRNELPTQSVSESNTTRFALAALLCVDGSREWWNQQKYIASAEKLAISFRRHSNLDMILLVKDKFRILRSSDEARLRNSGWSVHRIRDTVSENRGWFDAILFSKLWVWKLLMYELILYTDLDTLFVESPEILFRIRPSSQNPAMVLDTGHTHLFNTGVILLRPDENEFQRLIEASNENRDYTEQYFLNHFYHGRIITLDTRFNRQVCAQDNCLNDRIAISNQALSENTLKDTATIVHFNGDNKPWNLKNCINKNTALVCMFWKHYK